MCLQEEPIWEITERSRAFSIALFCLFFLCWFSYESSIFQLRFYSRVWFFHDASFKLKRCVRLCTFRVANVTTRLVPSFGKLSLLSTSSIPLVYIKALPIYNSKGLMFTTMRRVVVDFCPVLCSWILNLVPWTTWGSGLMARYSGLITSFLASLGLKITGPRAIIPKGLSSLIQHGRAHQFHGWVQKGCHQEGGRKLWLSSGVSSVSLFGRRY